jgi:hypothetical protein
MKSTENSHSNFGQTFESAQGSKGSFLGLLLKYQMMERAEKFHAPAGELNVEL